MHKRDLRILAAATLAAGFLGGALSGLLLHGAPALAQGGGQGEAVREVVTARAFVLVDQAGKERASLRLHEDGVTRLTILDAAGKRRATLGVTKAGVSALMLYDAADETRVGLMARSEGVPVLALFDAAGGMRVGLESRKDGAPGLKMYDGAGKAVWSAP